MQIAFILVQAALWASLGVAHHNECRDDGCARYVTSSGIDIETRRSACSRILASTVRPPPVLVTTTVTKYIAEDQREKGEPDASPPDPSETDSEEVVARGHWHSYRCNGVEQFSSACRCWTQITAQTTTLPTATETVTKTVRLNIACVPAATAVSASSRFPCSAGTGMCSCLRLAGFWEWPREQQQGLSERSSEQQQRLFGVCVRVADRVDDRAGWGSNVTGPCTAQDECPADAGCTFGDFCVFDGSCLCGRRRCYTAVPGGCDHRALAGEEIKRRERVLEKRARDYLGH